MRLDQIASVAAGHPFRGRIPEMTGTGVIAVQMKDTTPDNGVRWEECVETEAAARRGDWLEPGDILVAARGNRNYAVLIDASIQQTGKQVLAAPHFFIVRAVERFALPAYLHWYLNQPPAQRYLELHSEGTLTKAIKRTALAAALIPIPALEKQHVIVALADALKQEARLIDQLRRNNEQLLEAIADDLLKDTIISR